MAQLSRRVARLAKQLGVDTLEEVQEAYTVDSNRAAQRVEEALKKVLKDLQSSSPTEVFSKYKVVKERLSDKTTLKLRKSGLEVTGTWDWLIYVEGPDEYNLFDVLDEGRKELPYRTKPYPLWGAALRERKSPPPEKFPSNSRVSGVGLRGSGKLAVNNPYGAGRSAAFGGSERPRGGQGDPMVFSRGPISAIKEKKLYERALERAKEALKGTGFEWEVIIVQRDTRGGA